MGKREFVEELREENERSWSEDPRRAIESTLTVHFPMRWLYVFELVQNALDAKASRLRIETSPDSFVLSHDGSEQLEERHVRAFCQVGRSTKGLAAVGFMGVGFKSVFRRFRTARVSGSGWRFRFDIGVKEGAVGSRHLQWMDALLPRWDSEGSDPGSPWTTRIALGGPHDLAHSPADDLEHLANPEYPAPLAVLALRGLRSLEVNGVHWELDEDRETHTVSVRREKTAHRWLIVRREYRPSDAALRRFLELRRVLDEKLDLDEREVLREVVGLVPLDARGSPAPLPRGRVCATLPLEETIPLGMHVQADWLLDGSRQGLREVEGDPWQEAIVEQIPGLLADYLEWLREQPESALAPGYSVLGVPGDNAVRLERHLRSESFRKRLDGALRDVEIVPTCSEGVRAFRPPAEVRRLPAPFRAKFATRPERRSDLLFGREVLDHSVFQDRALGFANWLGWFSDIAPCEVPWPDGLSGWSDALGQGDRTGAVLDLWEAIGNLGGDWLELPCCPTEGGLWTKARALRKVSGKPPSTDEPGGDAVLKIVGPGLPSEAQTLRSDVRKGLASRYVLARWLESYETEIRLAEIIKKEFGELASSAGPPLVAFFELFRWARLRGDRRDLVQFVVAGGRVVRPRDALLADPYVPRGEVRRRAFPDRPPVSPLYAEGESDVPALCRFFEELGLNGSIVPKETGTPLDHRETHRLAQLLLLAAGGVEKANRKGYLLRDWQFPEGTDRIRGDDLAWLLAAEHPGLRGKGRKHATSSWEGDAKTTHGTASATWIENLRDWAWVPCVDGELRRPSDVLLSADEGLDGTPVADLDAELVKILQVEGLAFGSHVPKLPAIQRLQRLGGQLDDDPLAALLEEAVEAARSADGGEDELRRALEGVRIAGVPLDRVVSRTGTGATLRSDLGGWVLDLSRRSTRLRAALELVPGLVIHPTTTGRQALEYLKDVWARVSPDREGKAPERDSLRRFLRMAYSYVLEEQEVCRDLKEIAQDDPASIQLYAGRRWRSLEDRPCLDDIGDRRLRELASEDTVLVRPGDLGSDRETQRKVAAILGVERLSDRLAIQVQRGSQLPDATWLPRLRSLLDMLASRKDAGAISTIECYEFLELEARDKRFPVAAYFDEATAHLSLTGDPADFAGELGTILLGAFELGGEGELAVHLTIALVHLDAKDTFRSEAQKIAEALDIECPLPEAGGPPDPSPSTVGREDESVRSSEGRASPEPGESRAVPTGAACGVERGEDRVAEPERLPRGGLEHGRASASDGDPDANEGRVRRGIDGFGVYVRPSSRASQGSDASETCRDEPFRSDALQRQAVVEYEIARGREPREMPFEQVGYDVESHDPRRGVVRRIEVKGMKGKWESDASVVMSEAQFSAARNAPSGQEYWLYVVDQTETDIPQVFPLPWTRAGTLQYGYYASHWRELAENELQEDLPHSGEELTST
ncbi:MAG: DUF3883 domain-containing protein [Planctomycetes bacterium]|nr:DUF3883 domain-containing protein [Planctomycetota bacterium]